MLSGTWAGPNLFMTRLFQLRQEILAKLPERYAELSALLVRRRAGCTKRRDVLQQAMDRTPSTAEAAVTRERMDALLAHDCRDRLSNIVAPTLVLGAEDDMIVPAYLQEELVSHLGNTELHMFDKGGHFYPITRSSETAEVMRAWMAKL